jgi:hypothetical protein
MKTIGSVQLQLKTERVINVVVDTDGRSEYPVKAANAFHSGFCGIDKDSVPFSSLNARRAFLCARRGLMTSNETEEAITIAKIITSTICSFRNLVSRVRLS